MPGIRDALLGQLKSGGFYVNNPQKVRNTYLAIGFCVLFAAPAGLVWLASASGTSILTAVLAGAFCGVIMLVFALIMPARTMRGARVRVQVLGFEEFLNRAEKDHLDRLVNKPELFDKYLPFAMALGVESKWAGAFENMYRQPPDWYSGNYPDGFHTRRFVYDLNAMSQRTSSAFVSSPRSESEGSGFSSSGSSGFGGGGSSGGGFGGGGGGAF